MLRAAAYSPFWHFSWTSRGQWRARTGRATHAWAGNFLASKNRIAVSFTLDWNSTDLNLPVDKNHAHLFGELRLFRHVVLDDLRVFSRSEILEARHCVFRVFVRVYFLCYLKCLDFNLFTFFLVNINGNRLKQFSLAADFSREGIFVVRFLLVVDRKRVDRSIIARTGALNWTVKFALNGKFFSTFFLIFFGWAAASAGFFTAALATPWNHWVTLCLSAEQTYIVAFAKDHSWRVRVHRLLLQKGVKWGR